MFQKKLQKLNKIFSFCTIFGSFVIFCDGLRELAHLNTSALILPDPLGSNGSKDLVGSAWATEGGCRAPQCKGKSQN